MNEEYFNSWQNRTNTYKSTDNQKIEKMFDGEDIHAEVEVTFDEVMQEGGIRKEI